ncbi:hypothetical protein BX600DRAFT_499785 [Xylariales sp. PMI_506]|nr:hypothetical protein BX600DRAFT_499785 [Xylariales sp. PMI_506]
MSDEAPQILKQRHRRVRTGCERCRAQRRKCDEEKPRCRRCANASATCKYIADVFFQDKNFQQLSTDTIFGPSSTTTMREYPMVEQHFITQGKASSSSIVRTIIGHTHPSQDHIAGLKTVPGSHIRSQRQAPRIQSLASALPHRLPGDELEYSWPLVGICSLSSEEVGLLRYYGHHLAPWLDVYDQNQTFRHLVPRMAMNSPCVLDGLLRLSAVSSQTPIRVIENRGVGALHLQAMSKPLSKDSPFSTLRLMAGFVFTRTLILIQADPDTWKTSFHEIPTFPDFHEADFADATEQQMWYSFVTLLTRIEIASSLMNQIVPIAIPNLVRQIPSLSNMCEDYSNQPGETLNSSLQCLQLLANVMNHCLPVPEAAGSISPQGDSWMENESRIAAWKALLNKLWIWQTKRPPKLKAILEVEGHEFELPTVIYASGAGVSSNTLYHMAMHLLLSNKPYPISLAECPKYIGLGSAQMSPYWHARRVCGIAVNSDPEHTNCWDPLMVAAVSLTARHMIHPSQQRDIMACLSHTKAAGWYTEGLVQRLRDEWNSVH